MKVYPGIRSICLIFKRLRFFCNKSCNGVNFEFQYDDTALYLKLLVLLYADDTVVLGTDKKEFQNN